MEIKTTVRYHVTPVRMAIIKKFTNSKCWRGCGEKGTLLHSWWECKLVQPLRRTVWLFLKKIKIELPYDPVIPILGIYPEKRKTLIQKDISTPMFIAAVCTIAKTWKQPKCSSTYKWIKNMWLGFPGGAVVKNSPANAGDMGSSPGLGRSHMPQSN